MKIKCPKCKEFFEIDKNRYDEGDSIECPECGASSVVVVKKGRITLEPEENRYDDVDEEYFGEDYDKD